MMLGEWEKKESFGGTFPECGGQFAEKMLCLQTPEKETHLKDASERIQVGFRTDFSELKEKELL